MLGEFWTRSRKALRQANEEGSLLLFFTTLLFTVGWCAWIAMQAFRLSAPEHVVSYQITLTWQGLMAVYTSNNGLTRWHKPHLHGSNYGKTAFVFTILYAIALYTAHMLSPDVQIPDAFYLGIDLQIANVGGWQTIKALHARKQKNGNGHNGTTESGPGK